MDTTKIIKLFVILELILLVAGFIIWPPTQSHLPPLLQEYLDQEMETINIVDLITIPVLLIYIISAVGLLLTKIWAKNLYVLSTILVYALIPFMGPAVEHAFFATINHLGSLITGAILALLYFTSSAFNKANRQEPSAETR